VALACAAVSWPPEIEMAGDELLPAQQRAGATRRGGGGDLGAGRGACGLDPGLYRAGGGHGLDRTPRPPAAACRGAPGRLPAAAVANRAPMALSGPAATPGCGLVRTSG
jgi:hypothetical protein